MKTTTGQSKDSKAWAKLKRTMRREQHQMAAIIKAEDKWFTKALVRQSKRDAKS